MLIGVPNRSTRVKKRKEYVSVDTSKMDKKELAAYRKRLAAVREYARVKREWAKKIKQGKLHAAFTLQKYRAALARGEKLESLENMKADMDRFEGKIEGDFLGRAKRLIAELERAEANRVKLRREIAETLGKLA